MKVDSKTLAACLLLVQSACAAPAQENESAPPVARGESPLKSNDPAQPWSDEGVADLPFSRGHKFATLDDYLSYLEQYNGTIDMPWWRQIEPGLYRYEIRMAGNSDTAETATRAELAERYGFDEDN